jgi:hypothetical protein
LHGERQTRVDAFAIYQHRACAARALIAAFFRSAQPQMFAERVKQGHTRLKPHLVLFTINA